MPSQLLSNLYELFLCRATRESEMLFDLYSLGPDGVKHELARFMVNSTWSRKPQAFQIAIADQDILYLGLKLRKEAA